MPAQRHSRRFSDTARLAHRGRPQAGGGLSAASPGIKFLTNVYLVTASQPLVKDAIITLAFSDGQPAPSTIYRAEQSDGGWTDIGSTGASAPWTISAQTRKLG